MSFWNRWFPGRKIENASSALGEEFADFLRAQIGGTFAGTTGSAPVQQIAALVGRAFSSARVFQSRPTTQRALTAKVLFRLGRELIVQGESVWYLKATAARGLQLFPVDSYDVSGGYDEQTHTYRLTLAGPTTSTEIQTTRARVLHFSYIKMTASTSVFSQLLARVEEHFRDESRSPRGHIGLVGDVGDDKTRLVEDLSKMRGNINLYKSVVPKGSGFSGGSDQFKLNRVGMNPPQAMVELQDQLHRQTLNLFGISSGLFHESSGAAREAYRQFVATLVQPLAGLVTEELRAQLDDDTLQLRFDGLRSGDIISRTRSYKNLTDERLTKAEALELAGLGSQ